MRALGRPALHQVSVAGEPEEFGDLVNPAVADAEAVEVSLPAPPGPDDVAFLRMGGTDHSHGPGSSLLSSAALRAAEALASARADGLPV
ncbi:hypothetical protein [Kineococcus arenarius]|uniref:hypothetical protein n=1 Tax=Kineococcus sp. SYSU DK007 TaxID=3383128 RepID=UPI003D7EB0E1